MVYTTGEDFASGGVNFLLYTTGEDFASGGVDFLLYTTGGDFEFCGVTFFFFLNETQLYCLLIYNMKNKRYFKS